MTQIILKRRKIWLMLMFIILKFDYPNEENKQQHIGDRLSLI